MQYKVLKTPLQTRNINQDFVLASLNSDGEALPDLFAEHKEILDWDWIFAFSQRHKISGIFVNSLEKFGIVDRLPREIQNQIDLIKRRAQQRAARAGFTLQQLHEALNKNNISFLVLKGSVFIHDLYEEPAVRPYYDIDLLVPPHLVDKTEGILVSLGYKFYCPLIRTFDCIPLGRTPKSMGEKCFTSQVTRKLFKRFHNHFPYVLPREDRRLPVDLHWQLFRPGVLKTEPASVWNHTREIKFDNLTFTTLSPEASLLYLATKIAADGPEDFSLGRVCDFCGYLKFFEGKTDLQTLEKTAGEWDAKNYLSLSLRLAKKLLDPGTIQIFHQNITHNACFNFCFFISTRESLLMPPRRKGVLGFLTINVCSLFWDLGIFRMPRRAVKASVRSVIRFCQKRFLPKDGAD